MAKDKKVDKNFFVVRWGAGAGAGEGAVACDRRAAGSDGLGGPAAPAGSGACRRAGS